MIDLDKIGYNVIQKNSDGTTEITGGLTLTVQIKVSGMAPDPEALAMHVKKRIREKIWEMAYGHLREPMKELKVVSCDPQMSGFHEGYSREIKDAVDKLEEAIGEP